MILCRGRSAATMPGMSIILIIAVTAAVCLMLSFETDPNIKIKPEGWVFPQGKLETLESSPELLQIPESAKPHASEFDMAKVPPKVEYAELPGQWQDAALWSNWGDSFHTPDGMFYCTIGDHHHPHGQALIYRVNPKTKTIQLVVDFNELVRSPANEYGSGKIHGPLMDGGDGWIYFVGYPGGESGMNDEYRFKGDWMARYQPATGKVEKLSIPAPFTSVPASIIHQPTMVMCGVDNKANFLAYDLKQQKALLHGGPVVGMQRCVLMAKDGRTWYSEKDQGRFVRYDPSSNKLTMLEEVVPGPGGLWGQEQRQDPPTLRAASVPDSRGIAYGISKSGTVFSFDTNTEKGKEIARVFPVGPGYTAVCKLDRTETYLYYVPGSHGKSIEAGSPVMQLNVRTGRRKVIAFLNDYMRKQRNYNCGGTFGTALSPDGSQLLICFNGRELGKKRSWTTGDLIDFDLCAVVLLTIPKEERM